jgi:hypothetical protein
MAAKERSVVKVRMKVREHELDMQGPASDVHRAVEAWMRAIYREDREFVITSINGGADGWIARIGTDAATGDEPRDAIANLASIHMERSPELRAAVESSPSADAVDPSAASTGKTTPRV